MSDQQVKEFFASVLEGGPADRLDLDRAVAAGRRRRRLRTATTLASAAAVLVVVGALVVSALPRADRADLGGATLSPTPSATEPSASIGPDVVVPGTAVDWARALEPYLPAGTDPRAVTVDEASFGGIVRAAFRYTADGRSTALVVTAYAPGDRSYDEVYSELQASCSGTGLTCEKTSAATSGPVLVRRADDGTRVSASSVRATGVVVTVDSWNGDTDAGRVLPGSGAPGFSTEGQVFELVALAATVPLPASVLPTPTPVPTTDATTTEPSPSSSSSGPEPTPTGTAPTPEPTPTPTPKPAGLIGSYAKEACERQMTFEYRVPQPITGAVIEYVVCPHENGGTLVPYSVPFRSGANFDALDAALRRPGQSKADACFMKLDVQRPIFVKTNDGWFKVEQPTDGCGNRLSELLDAVTAIVGTA